MTTNKADIVEQAMYKASILGALFQDDPLTTTRASVLLEMTMTALENDGILLGWKMDEYPMDPDGDAESGLPDWSIDAVTSLLATKLYSSVMGGTRPDLLSMASASVRSLYPTELIQRESNPYMPLGAGNNSGKYTPQFQPVDKNISVGNDGNLDL